MFLFYKNSYVDPLGKCTPSSWYHAGDRCVPVQGPMADIQQEIIQIERCVRDRVTKMVMKRPKNCRNGETTEAIWTVFFRSFRF